MHLINRTVAALVLACTLAHAQDSEPEPVLPAAALVQPALLSGPDFHVVPEVAVRGYLADFLIDTKYGPLHADSVELLAIRVAELPALDALERASRSGAFAHALAERGRKTGRALVNVFAHPIDTITGLPAGVARFLGHEWELWSGRAQTLADRGSREFENKGDPYRAPPGPMTAGRDAAPDATEPPPEKKNRAWYARAGAESAREARRYLKYGQQRREMAKVLGVDPNSTNPLLNERLDRLAWAAVWGNFSGGAALGEITGTAGQVLSYTGKIDQYVYDLEPEQLRARNEQRLLAHCSDAFAVRQFLRRGGFTDTLRTALIDEWEKLKPAAGCNELIELAATTQGEVEARYLIDALKLIRRHADTGGTLLVTGAGVAWRTHEGKLLLPLPVDYLTWNRELAAFVDQPALAARDRTALIGGAASPLAQRELTARGFSLVLRAPFDGAPAYAQSDFAAPAQAGQD
jgi:hypothetical protein